MKIAVLGAGSYVSRATLPYLLRAPDFEAILYTRTPAQLMRWVVARGVPEDRISVESTEEFGRRNFDTIVNFIGAGDPRLVNQMGDSILALTADWDQRVLHELGKRPSAKYIFASSGVATGEDFRTPRKAGALLRTPAVTDHYAFAKAAAERRHRELGGLPIVDLRLYSFYSAEMGADLGYLVCAMVQALLSGSLLQVDEHDIARDYLHPADFSSALMAVMGSPPANVAYDLCSLAPVRKFDLLRRFQDQFGLQSQQSPWNGLPNKMNYYSEDFSLKELGFVPAMSSVDAVADQAATFLARRLAPNGG